MVVELYPCTVSASIALLSISVLTHMYTSALMHINHTFCTRAIFISIYHRGVSSYFSFPLSGEAVRALTRRPSEATTEHEPRSGARPREERKRQRSPQPYGGRSQTSHHCHLGSHTGGERRAHATLCGKKHSFSWMRE